MKTTVTRFAVKNKKDEYLTCNEYGVYYWTHEIDKAALFKKKPSHFITNEKIVQISATYEELPYETTQ